MEEEFINNLSNSLNRIEILWKNIGFDNDEKNNYRSNVFSELNSILLNYENIFINKKQEYIEKIAKSIDSIQIICDEIDYSSDEYFNKYSSCVLRDQLNGLENSLSDLQIIRNQRKINIKRKEIVLINLHNQLGIDENESKNQIQQIINTNTTSYLSQSILDKYDYYINECKKRKIQIDEEIDYLKNDILVLVKLLDISHSYEQQTDEKLYNYHMRLVSHLQELQDLQVQRKTKLNSIQNQMKSLWISLEKNPDNELNILLDPFKSCPLSENLIKECEKKLLVLQDNFYENIQNLLSKYRLSISNLWNKLSLSLSDYNDWKIKYYDLSISHLKDNKSQNTFLELESLLREHVNYEKQLQNQWDIISPIYKCIQRREQLIKDREEKELKAKSDPNRWNYNNLRIEEIERKKYTKQLSSYDMFLRKSITKWENDNNRIFLYNEKPFLKDILGDNINSKYHNSIPSSSIGKRSEINRKERRTKVPKVNINSTPSSNLNKSKNISSSSVITNRRKTLNKSTNNKVKKTINKDKLNQQHKISNQRKTLVRKSPLKRNIPSNKDTKCKRTPKITKQRNKITSSHTTTIQTEKLLKQKNTLPYDKTCPIVLNDISSSKKHISATNIVNSKEDIKDNDNLNDLVNSVELSSSSPLHSLNNKEEEEELFRISPTTPSFKYKKRNGTKTPRKPLSNISSITQNNTPITICVSSSHSQRSTLHVRSKQKTSKQKTKETKESKENHEINFTRLT